MARAGSGRKALQTLRARIDRLDRQIVKLVNDRGRLAAKIGQVKGDQDVPVYSPVREEEVLKNACRASKGPLSDQCIQAVFRELMSGARALQRTVKVAFLGPAYSFSHLGALVKFGGATEYVPASTIRAVFEEVLRNHVDFGVVPVENSTDGSIADTLDMFVESPLKICGEVRLRIHHNLLANCEQSEIRRVYSKPQALSQCRSWLAQNVPGAQLIDVASTTRAAELARHEPNAAAVASLAAAEAYDLRVVCADIEDFENNVTRFAVVGHQTAERSGCDKTSCLFEIPHKPGALFDVLTPLKRHRVNMTWIESHPAKTTPSEYYFFVDIEGHVKDAKVKRALAEVERKSHLLTVLGSFPRAETES